jgi:hypothetical protein
VCLPWQQQIRDWAQVRLSPTRTHRQPKLTPAPCLRSEKTVSISAGGIFCTLCYSFFAFFAFFAHCATSSVPPSLFAAADNLVGARCGNFYAQQKKKVNVNSADGVRLFAAINAN